MEFRKKYKGKSQDVPKDFLRDVGKLYDEQFSEERQDAHFSVYGTMNPEEVLLCVSLIQPDVLRAVSCYLSMDLSIKEAAKSPSMVTGKLKKMVDLAASWFADVLKGSSGIHGTLKKVINLESKWERVHWSGEFVYVKITRDNQILERAADRILKEEE